VKSLSFAPPEVVGRAADYDRRDMTRPSPVTKEEEPMLGALYERKLWLRGRRQQGKSRGFRVVGNRTPEISSGSGSGSGSGMNERIRHRDTGNGRGITREIAARSRIVQEWV
jgi:hypothetical protein